MPCILDVCAYVSKGTLICNIELGMNRAGLAFDALIELKTTRTRVKLIELDCTCCIELVESGNRHGEIKHGMFQNVGSAWG